MSTIAVYLRGQGVDAPWLVRARCGHYLEPGRCCVEEPNPPTTWCVACDDWAYFDGIEWQDGRIAMIAS